MAHDASAPATKGDIAMSERSLRGEIAAVKKELKEDIANLRTEFKGDMGAFRQDMQRNLEAIMQMCIRNEENWRRMEEMRVQDKAEIIHQFHVVAENIRHDAYHGALADKVAQHEDRLVRLEARPSR